MLKGLRVILAVVTIILSNSAFAAKYFDGNLAIQMCTGQSKEMSAGCAMFIVGSAETLRMVGYSDKKYCLSEDISNKQLRQEFVAFIMQNEDAINYSAASIFLASVMQNHSCDQK